MVLQLINLRTVVKVSIMNLIFRVNKNQKLIRGYIL